MKPGAMFQRLWNWNVAAVLILITLAWPGLWALWSIPPAIRPRPAPIPAPLIRHLPGSPDGSETIWSPMLFSLPTPYGFSRTVKEEWHEARGVPALLAREPANLKFNPSSHPFPMAARQAGLAREFPEATLYRPSRPEANGPAATGVSGEPFWTAARVLAAREFQLPATWREHLPAEEQPGSVTAIVEIDRNGLTRHVFVTEPHETPAFNAVVLELLRRARAAPGEQAVTGNVTLTRP